MAARLRLGHFSFWVRVNDSGVRAGSAISQYYDNLLAKLVVWAGNREEAIRRALRALDEYVVHGVATTIPAHKVVLDHPDFIAGTHHTRWVETEVDLTAHDPVPIETLPEDDETGPTTWVDPARETLDYSDAASSQIWLQ